MERVPPLLAARCVLAGARAPRERLVLHYRRLSRWLLHGFPWFIDQCPHESKDVAMALGSRIQREARQEIVRIAGLGLSPEMLASTLMATVQRVIPCDGYRMFALDPATRLITRLLAASDDDGWARVEWLRSVYLATDPLVYVEHDLLTRLELPVVVVHPRQEECWGYPPDILNRLSPREHQQRFHELNSPIGGILLAHFSAGGRWIAALQMYRRDAGRSFAFDDVALLRSIQAEIARPLAASLAREQAAVRSADPDSSGVLLLTPDYRVTLCTPAGDAWLARLHDADPDGHAPLPTAIWSAVAAMRASMDAPAAAIVAPTEHGPLRVEASAAGSDGSVAVVLVPERPPAPPGVPADWGLTRQERRAIELLLQGHSNREIAAALFVSENTVEFHLRHAYDKLGVRSRSQVLARYFREAWATELASEAWRGS